MCTTPAFTCRVLGMLWDEILVKRKKHFFYFFVREISFSSEEINLAKRNGLYFLRFLVRKIIVTQIIGKLISIFSCHLGKDGHVCWHSNRRLPCIVCRPRKKNFYFPFPFVANKPKFAVSVFVCSRQTEAAIFRQFHFPFAEFQKHGDMETETWKHEAYRHETWKHGDMETWRQGGMETWTWGHGDMDMTIWN
jgi:hypothetical protein